MIILRAIPDFISRRGVKNYSMYTISTEPFKLGIRESTEYFWKRIEWRSLMITKPYFLPNVTGWEIYVGG